MRSTYCFLYVREAYRCFPISFFRIAVATEAVGRNPKNYEALKGNFFLLVLFLFVNEFETFLFFTPLLSFQTN
jgi:hypothetical protein